MIFSSNAFIFAFLPAALIGYFLLGRFNRTIGFVWLVVASLAFYSYWEVRFLVVLLGSIAWNYGFGAKIYGMREDRQQTRRILLWTAIAGNLLLLCYFKYLFPTFGFLANHGLVPRDWMHEVVLPLGISFFTFTQIGYLVDCFEGRAKERGLLAYLLFVTFFPHLIAGPILHNREVMPQFAKPDSHRFSLENLAVGVAVFSFGIAKKVLLADPLGYVAGPGFAHPELLSAGTAWITLLAYSMQLYFDFSGYSDMAIGIARMFGITFPANFNSPYKATSIIDFWSRWHMTLTRYITLYLYNPVAMGASRARLKRGLSASRKATRNLPAFASLVVWPMFFTMALAGIWHGAGLQFLVFGLLHATYLSVNHAWRMFGPGAVAPTLVRTACSVLLTYMAVLLGQIFFRANDVVDAITIVGALLGRSTGGINVEGGYSPSVIVRLLVMFGMCWFLPNTQQIMRSFKPVLENVSEPRFMRLSWKPSWAWALFAGLLLLASFLRMSDVSTFLYFQF